MELKFDEKSGYNLDKFGFIRDPGKFEGEQYFVPYFYKDSLNGCWEQNESEVWRKIDEEDAKKWPTLRDSIGHTIVLDNMDDGSIYAEIYENEEDFLKTLEL